MEEPKLSISFAIPLLIKEMADRVQEYHLACHSFESTVIPPVQLTSVLVTPKCYPIKISNPAGSLLALHYRAMVGPGPAELAADQCDMRAKFGLGSP